MNGEKFIVEMLGQLVEEFSPDFGPESRHQAF